MNQVKTKSITMRKNKNYTTIFIHDFADETLAEAVDLRNKTEYSVIKPKLSALQDYDERYGVKDKLNKAVNEDVGHKFEIAGNEFTKVEDMDCCVLTLRDETAQKKGVLSEFGMFTLNGLLIEEIFKHKTDTLLFF